MTESKRKTKASQLSPAGQPNERGSSGSGSASPKSHATKEVAALKNQFEQVVAHRVNELTNKGAFAEFFAIPADLAKSISELVDDLTEVPVVRDDFGVTNPHQKIECSSLLLSEDKELIWKCLAVVRESFRRADGCPADGSHGYQWNMNWKHTRAEIDQVLESARLLRLEPEAAAEAVLASIFSDSVKNRRNFITHNIDGAYGAAQVLFNFLNPCENGNIKRVERVAQAVREHQVAPPEFMAKAATIMTSKKLKLPRFDAKTYTTNLWDEYNTQKLQIASIYKKISDPFNKEHLVEDLHRINFTDEEREMLKCIGIEEWYVPHPDNPDARIAHAVIAGDHSINYNHPEGFAKIALIRGPDTETLFEDSTVLDSLDSAVSSFSDSYRVLLPEVQPMAIAGLRRTQSAVERVTTIMRELFSGTTVGPKEAYKSGAERVAWAIERAHIRHPELFTVASNETYSACSESTEKALEHVSQILQEWMDAYGEIPFNSKDLGSAEPGAAKLPFWNAPLVYPERDSHGALALQSLTELQHKQFLFAARIRDIAVELLRAEQWIY